MLKRDSFRSLPLVVAVGAAPASAWTCLPLTDADLCTYSATGCEPTNGIALMPTPPRETKKAAVYTAFYEIIFMSPDNISCVTS